MSKNLEQEYLREIQNDIPDLWARIDAGIDKLEESKVNEASNVVSINTEVKQEAKTEAPKKKKGKKGGVIAIISVLSAAAILILVCAPVAILGIVVIGSNAFKATSSDTSMAMMETDGAVMYYEDSMSDEAFYEDVESEEAAGSDLAGSVENGMYSMSEYSKETLDSNYEMAALPQSGTFAQGEAQDSAIEEEAEDRDIAEDIKYVKGDLIAEDVLFRIDTISNIDGMDCLEVTVLTNFTPQAMYATDFERGQCMIVKSDDEKLWNYISAQIAASDSDVIFGADMYVDESGLNEYPLVYLRDE